MVPFESLGAVSYSSSIVTVAVTVAVSEIFSVKECRDLEIGAKGHSRSLEMAPFDRLYTTFYLSAIVTVPFSSYLTLNNIVTLKCGSEVTQAHWKWYHLLCLRTVSYSPSIVIMAVSLAISEIFSVKE